MKVRFLKNVNDEKIYPVAHAEATYLSDGRTVAEALKDCSGKGVEVLSREDYDALPDDDKKDILFVVEEPDTTLNLVFNGVILGGADLLEGYVTDAEMQSHIENPIHIELQERLYWNSKADGEVVDSHINNTDIHITTDERTYWNQKVDANEALDKITEDENGLHYEDDEICVTVPEDDEDYVNEEACYTAIFTALDW